MATAAAQEEKTRDGYGEGTVHQTALAALLGQRHRRVVSLLRVVSILPPLPLPPPPMTTAERKRPGRITTEGGRDRRSIASSVAA